MKNKRFWSLTLFFAFIIWGGGVNCITLPFHGQIETEQVCAQYYNPYYAPSYPDYSRENARQREMERWEDIGFWLGVLLISLLALWLLRKLS